MALTVVMCAAEFAAGLWTGSLMLLSDAVHMLSHAVSLAVSYLAIWMAARPRSARSNYGLHRAEILGSLVNGLGLFALSGWIVWESIERFQSPTPILGREMIAVAVLGLLVNAGTAWILARSGAEDLNTRSALLHMLGDLLSSVVIVLGGVALVFTDWTWLDPLLSMLVALVIVVWAFGLVRESTSVLLERAPRGGRTRRGPGSAARSARGPRCARPARMGNHERVRVLDGPRRAAGSAAVPNGRGAARAMCALVGTLSGRARDPAARGGGLRSRPLLRQLQTS